MKTNEVLENIKARRSVRAYTDRQVSEEDLQAILEAALLHPVGCIWRHGILPLFRMRINWQN